MHLISVAETYWLLYQFQTPLWSTYGRRIESLICRMIFTHCVLSIVKHRWHVMFWLGYYNIFWAQVEHRFLVIWNLLNSYQFRWLRNFNCGFIRIIIWYHLFLILRYPKVLRICSLFLSKLPTRVNRNLPQEWFLTRPQLRHSLIKVHTKWAFAYFAFLLMYYSICTKLGGLI